MALEHRREGSGEPLLLLHGIGCHWQVWQPVMAALAAERDVIAVDLPGFGGSAPLPGGEPPTVPALADAVARFAAGLGLERPHVAGNSLGGGVALHLGLTGCARSVTALSPVGFWRRRERAYAHAAILGTSRITRALVPFAGSVCTTAPGRTAVLGLMSARPWKWYAPAAADLVRASGRAPAFRETLEAMIGWDCPAGDLPVPTTVAWAEHDRLLIPRQRHRAKKLVPGARHVVLEDCGHLPFYDDPEQVARVMLEGSSG